MQELTSLIPRPSLIFHMAWARAREGEECPPLHSGITGERNI